MSDPDYYGNVGPQPIASPKLDPVQPPVTVADVPNVAPERQTKMTWLLALLNLIPVIATGIQTIHTDLDKGSKTQLAQDSLNLAIQGAQAAAPAAAQPLIAALAPDAQSILATTVSVLHDSATPAVATPTPSTTVAADTNTVTA